jgi:hypothetical protein
VKEETAKEEEASTQLQERNIWAYTFSLSLSLSLSLFTSQFPSSRGLYSSCSDQVSKRP